MDRTSIFVGGCEAHTNPHQRSFFFYKRWKISFTWFDRYGPQSGPKYLIVFLAAGKIYAWGENSDSQLGFDGASHRAVPAPVDSSETFVSIACGYYHSIALSGSSRILLLLTHVSLVLLTRLEKGKVFVWGYNADGQLGLEISPVVTNPTLLRSLEHLTVVSVDTGLSVSACLTGFRLQITFFSPD